MAVEVLWLRGRANAEATDEAERMIDTRTGPPDLAKLLVVDDTSLLAEHAAVFRRLGGARRVDNLLCVAIGPRPEHSASQLPLLPDSLAGPHGPGVLWVGDPDGIDWRDAPGTRIKGRKRGQPDGLGRLVELLHVEAVFDEVWKAFDRRVPYRVASPGLRLVGADDEAAAFKAALAVAIEGITASGAGDAEPFRSLLPDPGAAVLAADGPLAGCRARVANAVTAAEAEAAKAAGLLRRFSRADGVIEEQARATGAALGELRDQVIRLFRAVNSTDSLTSNQRETLRDAGLQFSPASQAGPQQGLEPDQVPSFRAIADAVDGGDTLPFVQGRLASTAKETKRYGSAAYLPQVDTACPASLPASLVDVTDLPAPIRRGGAAVVREELRLAAADRSAAALVTLVQKVANREWSPAPVEPDELDRARIAITGIQSAFAEYASAGTPPGAARHVRLSESLRPVLRALVCQVLKDEYGAPGATGQDTLDAAKRRTGDHLKDWADLVQAHGLAFRPRFAPSAAATEGSHTAEGDLAAIRDALQADPRGQMWQLCGQDDVTALDVGPDPVSVSFAPRQEKHELINAVPRDTLWLSAGSRAGLLRLVPLYQEIVAGDPLPREPSLTEPE
ncbi:MAG: hypothetical protein ACLPKE_07115 [Streptosporangiaceae bacterium]